MMVITAPKTPLRLSELALNMNSVLALPQFWEQLNSVSHIEHTNATGPELAAEMERILPAHPIILCRDMPDLTDVQLVKQIGMLIAMQVDQHSPFHFELDIRTQAFQPLSDLLLHNYYELLKLVERMGHGTRPSA